MSSKKFDLIASLLVCRSSTQDLLQQIELIEIDTKTPAEIKLDQIKKIREKLSGISQRVDNIKKEVMLLNEYKVN